MTRGLSKPVIVWMWQLGLALRYDRIHTAWGHTHAISVLLPGVNIVLCYTPRPHRAWRAVADWIRAVILRKTATPYECYWRDRAFAAEKRIAILIGR